MQDGIVSAEVDLGSWSSAVQGSGWVRVVDLQAVPAASPFVGVLSAPMLCASAVLLPLVGSAMLLEQREPGVAESLVR